MPQRQILDFEDIRPGMQVTIVVPSPCCHEALTLGSICTVSLAPYDADFGRSICVDFSDWTFPLSVDSFLNFEWTVHTEDETLIPRALTINEIQPGMVIEIHTEGYDASRLRVGELLRVLDISDFMAGADYIKVQRITAQGNSYIFLSIGGFGRDWTIVNGMEENPTALPYRHEVGNSILSILGSMR